MNASRRIALLVPGMHRSGTSALTGTLALLGAQAPKHLIPSSRNNPRGHWESTELMRFHDEVLASEGLQWSDWSQFNPHWMESAVGRSFIARLPQVIVSEFGEAQLLLVKDPRICRLLPLWIKVLSEMDISPRFVLPFRNPLEVAGSLGARNKFGRNQSQLMWLRHVLDAEFETRGHKRVLVEYSDLLADWRMQVRRMSECLELEWPKQINEVGADIDAFLSKELRHHVAPIPDASSQGNEDSLCIDKWVVDAYQALRDLSAPAADAMQDMACLGRLRNELDQSGAIAASVFRESELRSRERVQDLSERLDRIEKRCKALDEQNAQREVEVQKALADRDQKVSKLEIRMAQVKESLAERDRTIGELELRTARTMRALKETERACAAVVVEKEEVQSEGRARLEWSEREVALCRRLIGEQEERLHAMRADVGRRLLMKLRRLFRMLPEHGKPEALSDLEVINQSGLFDHAWYLQRYPDVRMHKMDPLVHYMQHGANEGRDPGIGFSTMGYLRRYPDVKASGLNPLLHYVRYGLWEGRIACAREEDVK